MTIAIVVPQLGESVVEATVGKWHKQVGDAVAAGELLVELQTDKVDLEVNAAAAGVLRAILKPEGSDVAIGELLGELTPAAAAAAAPQTAPQTAAAEERDGRATPVARRVAAATGVDLAAVEGSGKGGKVRKADLERHSAAASAPSTPPTPVAPPAADWATLLGGEPAAEERVKLSRRRRTIARRLVEAQQTAAMLTTFNEIDMSAVIALRQRRQAWFEAQHGVRLGFTSFFTKAVVAALRAFPRLNAELDGDELILKRYYHIGIAVGAEEGLVVPVLRHADRLSFAAIERQVRAFAAAARDGSLTLADLLGGTFTITNGGVFGSMLSTPILNPPQVGILGLHNIVERPVAHEGAVVIRPIMYVALTYDHRIIDGREAVQFLVHIKQLIEDPEALFLGG